MTSDTLTALAQEAKNVVFSLGWEIYHTPENLTLFLLGEAAELGEFCQWSSKDQLRGQKGMEVFKNVEEEMADVLKSVLYLANVLPTALSLEVLVSEKLRLDKKAYPVEKFKGAHRYEKAVKERRKEGIPPFRHTPIGVATSLPELQKDAWQFVEEREWVKFYSPASLALAICVKSGEVATCYQRRPKPIEEPYHRLMWAMADILLNLLRLAEYLEVDNLGELVSKKMDDDVKRFKATTDLEAVSKFIDDLKAHLNDLGLDTLDQAQAKSDIETIEAQVKSPRPKSNIISECLKSLRAILEGAVGSLIATGLLQQLAVLIK